MTKKVFRAFLSLLFVLLLFSACAPVRETRFAPRRDGTYRFAFDTQGQTLTGELTIFAPNDLRFTILAPDGSVYCDCLCTDEGVRTPVGGTTDLLPYTDLPDDAPMKVLPLTLMKAIFTPLDFTKADGGYFCETTAANTPVQVTFSPDGSLQTVTAGELTAEFTPVSKE